MIYALFSRDTLSLSILRDRNPLFVTLSDGQARNGYTLKIINREREARPFRIEATGLAEANLAVMGRKSAVVEVPGDEIRSVKVFVSAPPPAGGKQDLTITVTDGVDGRTTSAITTFRGPEQ